MEVKEAVKIAKEHIRELYEAEGIRNVGLEEVKRSGGVWEVTVGFSRPWDFGSPDLFGRSQDPPRRAYKVVEIDDIDGEVMSVISHSADVSR